MTALELRILAQLKLRLTVRQITDIALGRKDHGVTVREAGIIRRYFAS